MSNKPVQKPVRVGLISLGCAKNLVDAEIMLGSLLQSGAQITSEASEADVLIVNTCSFISSAQEEGVDTILQSDELRQAHRPGQALVVSGCLPQRFRDELPKLLPEVDAFMGIDQVTRINEIIAQALAHRAQRLEGAKAGGLSTARKSKIVARFAELEKARGLDDEKPAGALPIISAEPLVDVNLRPTFIPDFGTPRYRLTPGHLAYVKIAEGCNHPCSFCIIPRMRGSHRSRPQPDIVAEARQLIAEGVKELNLISQDTTYYGLDLRPRRTGSIASPEKFREAAESAKGATATICSLIRELNALEGDFWIRLLYTHPAHWTDELIHTIAESPKVARYVDIPLQHIHELMLERMRRETSQQYIVDLLKKIRAGIPGIALRTTFIVGFPGETDRCFEGLLDFIKETRFERLGVFTYSQEDGTRAARMENQVPERIKKKRRDLAMRAQHEVAAEVSGGFVGRKIKVLVEKEAEKSDLQQARISSWEHGLIRSAGNEQSGQFKRGKYVVARGEADAPDIDGRVYVRGRLPIGRVRDRKNRWTYGLRFDSGTSLNCYNSGTE